MQDPVKVKLERDAKSSSDDNRGADEDTDDRSAAKNEESSEAVEEDADGLGETDARAPVSGTESESVENAGIGVNVSMAQAALRRIVTTRIWEKRRIRREWSGTRGREGRLGPGMTEPHR